jgi:hypothetical protein
MLQFLSEWLRINYQYIITHPESGTSETYWSTDIISLLSFKNEKQAYEITSMSVPH